MTSTGTHMSEMAHSETARRPAMDEETLSLTFAAIADPTRRAMLSRLSTGETTVNELAAPFDMSVQAISKHLKVLERAGLVTRGRDAQFRPCRFEPAALDDALGWIDRHLRIWTERYDKLEQHLSDLQRPSSTSSATSANGQGVNS